MLTTDQIDDQLNAISQRRSVLDRAAAALNIAAAVAHLREQFPTAAYAWIHAGTSMYDGGSYEADILRVHDSAGAVLWDPDAEYGGDGYDTPTEPASLSMATDSDAAVVAFALTCAGGNPRPAKTRDPVEIESPATDALVAALRADENALPTFYRHAHPVAGVAPSTDQGDDPVLLVFADVDKAAQAAVFAAEVTPVAVPQINNGQPTLVLFAVPSDRVTGIDTFEQADAAKLGPPAVVDLRDGELLAALGPAPEAALSARWARNAMETTGYRDPAGIWHAADCGGTCDGCGFIAVDMRWYPGPTPPADKDHQTARSEYGKRFADTGTEQAVTFTRDQVSDDDTPRCQQCGRAEGQTDARGLRVTINPQAGICKGCIGYNLSRN